MKILKTFSQLREMGYDLSKCIDFIMEDSSEYIKISLLRWPRNVIEFEAENEDVFLREMMAQHAQFLPDLEQNFYEETSSS